MQLLTQQILKHAYEIIQLQWIVVSWDNRLLHTNKKMFFLNSSNLSSLAYGCSKMTLQPYYFVKTSIWW